MFGRSVKTRVPTTPPGKSESTSRDCPRCRQPVRASAPRCPVCGNRLFFGDAASVEPACNSAPQTESADPAPDHGLTVIQKRILSAASGGGAIYVYVEGPGQGEIKSGTQRFYGDDAVTALATMVAPGLVAVTGEDCFELTNAGLQLAGSLF